jgi:hypothetical protein
MQNILSIIGGVLVTTSRNRSPTPRGFSRGGAK